MEPSVWTERMSAALEEGVKGGVWFSLIDKVFLERNLRAAAGRTIASGGAPGVDHVTVEAFSERLDAELARLGQTLKDGSYEPQAIRRTFIPKPGSSEQRPLGIPTVRDRVVQGAVRNVIEPIFEREFAEQSYGFRPGRSCRDALRRVDFLLKNGFPFVVDADLKSFFDTIPHDRLMSRLQGRIADKRLLRLVESFLKAGVFDGFGEWEPEAGAPQGAVISPLLSNVYLNPLDHLVAAEGLEMVRYADDFVVLCRSQEEAEQALTLVRRWCEAEGLTLHPEKTRIVDVRTEGFDFLGYHFATTRRGRPTRWPRKKSLAKLKDGVRAETRRNNGNSMKTIVSALNPKLRGWFEYFKHSCRGSFHALDGWIRMRLRKILRARRSSYRPGPDADNHRWPNKFFAALGLFNLEDAHAECCRSCSR